MNDLPRVLVGVTVYKGKEYIFDKCIEHIKNFDYPSDKYDLLVVDNTDDGGRWIRKQKRLLRLPRVERTARGENSRIALTRSQNLIRKRFLEGDYDYLFMVESDLLVPRDQLKRLISLQLPVVGSTYNISRDKNFIPCIFISGVLVQGLGATRPVGVHRDENTGDNARYDPEEVNFWLKRGGVRRCHGCGLGCTLIERSVVEQFAFWCDVRFENKHSDVYFYLDLERANIPVYVDVTRIIPHFPSKWEEVKDR